ncbi:MAG TPA: HEAT repeat domain-containing protein [Rhodopila sp.]|nr:HEAT repeat domain-containing protein [Rhodopila sp.]
MFAGGFVESGSAPPALTPPAETAMAWTDAELIAALPDAVGVRGRSVIAEIGRRRLVQAISGLAAICRRFKGFGLERRVAEQADALQALSEIGGRDAAAAVTRLIGDDVIQGPTLAVAMAAAAALQCRLPASAASALLRHPDPAIRAAAACCATEHPSTLSVMIDLLDDLHPPVVTAAVRTLAHWGRAEARPELLRRLNADPTAELIAAAVGVADDAIVVTLGRIGRVRPDLTKAVLEALAEIDDPRAAILLTQFGPTGGS